MALDSPRLRLYELVLEDGRSASPFVWRIRYALAHKRIAHECVSLDFEHGHTAMAESWDIAEYLDRAFPEQPPLFSSPAERSMIRLFDYWFLAGVVRPLLPVYVLDVHNAARPVDRPYFRESREARFGSTLEAFSADRRARLPAIREALSPLRRQLDTQAFLGGDAPNYAD